MWRELASTLPFAGITRIRFKGSMARSHPLSRVLSQLPVTMFDVMRLFKE